MRDDEFWKSLQDSELTPSAPTRTGVLNLALLFGTAAIALALVLAPVLSSKTGSRMMAETPGEFDMISTGSVPAQTGARHYTIRRSILQEMPGAVCVIDGERYTGDC